MTEIDDLPADQRAVLQLLVKQGQTYEDLSGLLDIDRAAVRERARSALEALGPDAGRRLAPERRAEISDYLLGQQSASEQAATRDHLAGSASSRAWARVVADSLRPLAGGSLPEIPAEAPQAEARDEERPAAAPAAGVAAARDEPSQASAAAGPEPPRDTGRQPRSSRLGGALLLGGIGVLVAVVAILLLTSGGGGSKSKASTLSSTPTTGTGTTAQATPVAQINLRPPSGGKALGLAQVFAQGNRRLLIVAGQGVSPGAYALWLYTSPTKSRLLGFVPSRVGKDGKFVTQGVLPSDATGFQNLVVTSEKVSGSKPALPKQPGAIILQGKLQTG
ncbi:MAG TPA: hypothetical protein VGN78_10885 [Solirubrobacteraceae bacterium]|jgi:hypothetical protein|nr:hypothetical protein [Solirubrobacteraceae bacterium]